MWSNQENRVRKQVKNPCEARKIKATQNLHKIISTHLLTMLIIRDIVQLEQKRGVQRDQKGTKKLNVSGSPRNFQSGVWKQQSCE